MARFGMRRNEGQWRGGFSDGRGFGGGMKAEELVTKTLYIQSKKFYVDVRENHRGKFMKISEVAPNGQKMKLIFDMVAAREFQERLTEFCEFFSTLGPSKWDRSRMMVDEGKLKSEVMFREDRRYYMDLKENHRGRFLKVSMTLPTHERTQIVIPAQGIVDVRDVLIDILAEYGDEVSGKDVRSKKAEKVESTTESSSANVEPVPSSMSLDKDKCITFENKNFCFDISESRKGKFLRISEVSPNFRTAITVPCESWEKFVESVERALVDRVK